jgi:glycosyltransferase involved in cell wall biosynthesis
MIMLRLARAARQADVIVSVSEMGMNVLLAKVAATITRRPLVITVHTPLGDSVREWVPAPLRRVTLAVNRRADASICVSRGLAAATISHGVPAGRVHVVTNGVDVPAIRAQADLDPGVELPTPLVVGIGRLTPQKGFDVLIEAHARAIGAGARHHLAIIGEGPDRPLLEKRIADLGVATSVTLLGYRDNPHAILRRADLFCLSSRWEGYPLVLIEALAVGVPIIATDCVSGPAEILADGRYGDLVKVESVDALATAISRRLADPDRARAAAAVDRAADFDPDHCAARYLEIFASLGGGPAALIPPPPPPRNSTDLFEVGAVKSPVFTAQTSNTSV